MAHITFVHGTLDKPPADQLLAEWTAGPGEGGLSLQGVSTSMVYWADVLYSAPEAGELESIGPPPDEEAPDDVDVVVDADDTNGRVYRWPLGQAPCCGARRRGRGSPRTGASPVRGQASDTEGVRPRRPPLPLGRRACAAARHPLPRPLRDPHAHGPRARSGPGPPPHVVVCLLDGVLANDFRRGGTDAVDNVRAPNDDRWRHSFDKYAVHPALVARLSDFLSLDA